MLAEKEIIEYGGLPEIQKGTSTLSGHVTCISGSSNLGSSEVALILDVSALFRQIERWTTLQLAA